MHKTDMRIVLLGFVLVVSCIQYVSQVQQYNYVRRVIRFDPRVLKRQIKSYERIRSRRNNAVARNKKIGVRSRGSNLHRSGDSNDVEMFGEQGSKPVEKPLRCGSYSHHPTKSMYFYIRWFVLIPYSVDRTILRLDLISRIVLCTTKTFREEGEEVTDKGLVFGIDAEERDLRKEKMEALKDVVGEGKYRSICMTKARMIIL